MLRRYPTPGTRAWMRRRAAEQARAARTPSAAPRTAAPSTVVLLLLVLLVAAGGGGWLARGTAGTAAAVVIMVAAAVAVQHRRKTVRRRRGGLYTAAEITAAAVDDHRLAAAVVRMLRRDGWRVRVRMWEGRPQVLAAAGDGRRLELTVRQASDEPDTRPRAGLRAVTSRPASDTLWLVVTTGPVSRRDRQWAQQQPGLHFVDALMLERWAAGSPLVQLLGEPPVPPPVRRTPAA